MNDDISPAEYHDVVGEAARAADRERTFQLGKEGERLYKLEFPSAKEFWEVGRIAAGYNEQLEKDPEPPAYFVSHEQLYGDPNVYGPYTSALEAEWRFSHTNPAFDGADVSVIKVAPVIAGISPKELREKAIREEYEINVDPETQKWGDLYDKSTTVVAWNEWKITQDQAGLIYHGAENKRDPEFQKEITQEADEEIERQIESERIEREMSEPKIESIYESQWHQGFGSECKEHLGKGHDGYYYALEMESDDDLSWSGPYNTREEAEELLGEAWERWDDRTGQQEQAWEDREIARIEKEEQAWEDHECARVEKEEQLRIERESDQQIEREIEASRAREKAYEMEM